MYLKVSNCDLMLHNLEVGTHNGISKWHVIVYILGIEL